MKQVFPFPQSLNGRAIQTELHKDIFGDTVYRVILLMNEDDQVSMYGSFITDFMVYSIMESKSLWRLRELVQEYDDKQRPNCTPMD